MNEDIEDQQKETRKPNTRLRRLRELRGWSRRKLALELQTLFPGVAVTEKEVARWERGKRTPGPYYREKLCLLFEKDAAELGLVEFEPEPLPVSTPSVPVSAPTPGGVIEYVETSHIIEQAPSVFDTAVVMLGFVLQSQGWTIEDLLTHVEASVRRNSMGQAPQGPRMTRKEMLSLLISLPLGILGLTGTDQSTSTLMAEEMIPLYSTAIPACLRSYFHGGDLQVIERVLPTYIAQLLPLAQQSSKLQKTAAGLVSQAHQLASMLVLQKEDFGTSLHHCNEASSYALLAEDPNLQAAALIRRVNTLYYRKRHSQISITLQEASQYLEHITPLLRARIYSERASERALYQQKQDALRDMGLARDSFPEHPEDDPGFLYTHTTPYILQLNAALTYRDLGQPKDAWDAIKQAEVYVPDEMSTRRIELVSHQAMTALVLGDLDLGCDCLEIAIRLSHALQSDLWLSDARDTYDAMVLKWPHESNVKRLEEVFH